MTPFTIYTAKTTGAKQNKVYPNEMTVDNLTALEQAKRFWWTWMILSNISQAKVKILLDFAALLWLPLLLPRACNNKITEEPIWQQSQNE